MSLPGVALRGSPARFPQVETVLDNRLASSSWRKVAVARGWAHIIATDRPDRGGKLVTFVLHGHRVGVGLDPDLRLGRAHVDAVAAPGGPGHGGSFLG